MKIEARRKTLEKLADEGVLEIIHLKWTADYIYSVTGWRAVDRDKLLFDYDETFFANTYIEDDNILHSDVSPELLDLRVDLTDEQIERYIRNTAKKLKEHVLELRNRETIKAIDEL